MFSDTGNIYIFAFGRSTTPHSVFKVMHEGEYVMGRIFTFRGNYSFKALEDCSNTVPNSHLSRVGNRFKFSDSDRLIESGSYQISVPIPILFGEKKKKKKKFLPFILATLRL